MASRKQTLKHVTAGAVLLAAGGLLTGCGVNQATPNTNYNSPLTIQGQVLAGKNYMAGAIVKIYITQPTGVATAGTYVGTAKLLTTVTASSTGNWSTTGVSCSSPDMLYVTAQGGTPYPSNLNTTTLGNNPNSLMMTAVGDCSVLSAASSSNNVLNVVTNEASTVSAVEALRPFISLSGTTVNVTSSATNYAGTKGVGSAGNFAGLAHAFLNAANLSPYSVGDFQQYTSSASSATGGGLVPVDLLNTIAYALYLCTIGGPGGAGDYSYCANLYQLTTPSGGTAPTTTLQAMLNIATYPANNAAAIVSFAQTPIPYAVPSQPGPQIINVGVYVPDLNSLGSSFADLSVAIFYLPGYAATTTAPCNATPVTFTCTGQGVIYPSYVTVDANDSAYFTNPTASSSTMGNVIALSSAGVPLWTSANDSTNLITPRDIAADQYGHLWLTSSSTAAANSFVQELDANTGTTLARYPSSSTGLFGIAVDSIGNVWYDASTTTGQNIHEIARNGSSYAEATLAPLPLSAVGLTQIRPDPSNNIWAAQYSSATSAAGAVFLPNTGTAAAPTYTAGLKTTPLPGVASYGVATDASSNAYLTSQNTSATNSNGGLYRVSLTGTGATAVGSVTSVAPNPSPNGARFMEIDGSSNIWFLDSTTGIPLYRYSPSTNSEISIYPCYQAGTNSGTPNTGVKSADGTTYIETVGNITCTTGISNRIDLAADATGSLWVASPSNSGGGRIAQILGITTPTVPLRALGKPGVMP